MNFFKSQEPIKPLWTFCTYYGTNGEIIDFGYEEDSQSTGDVKSIRRMSVSTDQTPMMFVKVIPDWIEEES